MLLRDRVPPCAVTVLVQMNRHGKERIELATFNVYRNGKTSWLIQHTMMEIEASPDDNWWNIPSVAERKI